MDIFDKIGKKATETYKYTAEKTGKLAKEAKLRLKMNENKVDINELYKQIGKKVYEKHVVNQPININEELEEECTKIDVLSQEVENILKEILLLKDKKQCPNCFEQIDKSACYCPNCGTKQEIKEEVNEEETEKEEQTTTEDEPAKEVEVIEQDQENNNNS